MSNDSGATFFFREKSPGVYEKMTKGGSGAIDSTGQLFRAARDGEVSTVSTYSPSDFVLIRLVPVE